MDALHLDLLKRPSCMVQYYGAMASLYNAPTSQQYHHATGVLCGRIVHSISPSTSREGRIFHCHITAPAKNQMHEHRVNRVQSIETEFALKHLLHPATLGCKEQGHDGPAPNFVMN